MCLLVVMVQEFKPQNLRRQKFKAVIDILDEDTYLVHKDKEAR